MPDISFLKSDLYYKGRVVVDGQGELILERAPFTYVPSVNDETHVVVEGDRLDLIAYRYYKELIVEADKYYWLIADANDILNPLDLSSYIGREIVIPDILNIIASR